MSTASSGLVRHFPPELNVFRRSCTKSAMPWAGSRRTSWGTAIRTSSVYSELDLWRFTSQGNRLFDGSDIAPFAYFSLDGGVTKRADWAIFRTRAIFEAQTRFALYLTPNDPFNEDYMVGTQVKLTETDTLLMNALVFAVRDGTIGPDPGEP